MVAVEAVLSPQVRAGNQERTLCQESATTYSSILLQVDSTAASSMWGKDVSSSMARGHSACSKAARVSTKDGS